ncbi:MAG: hypothetical protein WBH90_02115 [Aggregatilineales bacterium]|nr:hypothetical protein [Aggregatilineales bacterium]HQE19303.1 hypothetical protein [Aggregatilineales bacterium]
MLFGLIVTLLVAAACRPAPVPTPERPTPIPVSTVEGRLLPPDPGVEVSGRAIALCRIVGVVSNPPAACELLGPAVRTDVEGRFRFGGVVPGVYLLVYDSGLADFETALAVWAGEALRPGDWPWLRDDLLKLAGDVPITVYLPPALAEHPRVDRPAYATLTLSIDGSPFIFAHEIDAGGERPDIDLLLLDLREGGLEQVTVTAYTPRLPDLAAERERLGPLTLSELALFDQNFSSRWMRFVSGDDSAYRPLDAQTIDAVRRGMMHEIGGAYFTTLDMLDGELIAAPAYLGIDLLTGERHLLAWLDQPTGDVIELRTGYRLNVLDRPGVWIEEGPNGERFYHYGFSYYRRWGQILPDPLIRLADDFYTEGSNHVSRYINDYRAVAGTFQGDLRRLQWYPSVLEQIDRWKPKTAPFVRLPDSGTVDIRRERFEEAITSGAVVVDEESVEAFLRSTNARRGLFSDRLTEQEVTEALLTPYRSGRLFSDLEAAIILDATYNGDRSKPLTIRISRRLNQGFLVPRYRDKEVLISQTEVANVILGYPGSLNSRWAHEMGHIIDFRSPQYAFEGRPPEGSRCEPAKYLIEFMWWVQRYPGDAPDWDWMPINSGLTLARLLTEEYHNSRC